jgi:hypothetical protein
LGFSVLGKLFLHLPADGVDCKTHKPLNVFDVLPFHATAESDIIGFGSE